MCQFFAKFWPEKQFSCKKNGPHSGDFKWKISKFPDFYVKFQLLAKKDSAFFLSSYLVGSQIWLNVPWSSRDLIFSFFSGERIGKYCQKWSNKLIKITLKNQTYLKFSQNKNKNHQVAKVRSLLKVKLNLN